MITTDNKYSYKNKDFFYIIISTIFLLVVTSSVTSFWIERISSYELDFSQGDKYSTISGLFLIVGLICYSIKNKKALYPLISKNKLIFIIALYCLISCIWSQDTFITLRKALKIFVIIYLIALFGSHKVYLKDILRCYIVFTLIASIILIIAFPEYGFLQYMGEKNLPKGIFSNKNFLGAFCACGILLIINYDIFKQYKKVFLLVLSILLLSTNSVTAIIGVSFSLFILCMHYILSRLNFYIRNVLIYSSILILIVLVAIVLYMSFNVDTLFRLVHKDTTFTGRDKLWEFFIGYSLHNNFLLGAGFNSFFNGYKTSWILPGLGWAAESAHSDYIQTLLDLGAVGVLLLILFIVSAVIKGCRDIRLLSIISFFIIESFFEINFLRTTFIFVTVLYSLVMYNNPGDLNE